jgi:hypothetical protein
MSFACNISVDGLHMFLPFIPLTGPCWQELVSCFPATTRARSVSLNTIIPTQQLPPSFAQAHGFPLIYTMVDDRVAFTGSIASYLNFLFFLCFYVISHDTQPFYKFIRRQRDSIMGSGMKLISAYGHSCIYLTDEG